MADYIKREAVMKLFDKVGCYLNPKCLQRQKERIESIPTADVVEVVRCKNCAYANDDGTICRYGVGRSTKPNGYCHNGERRDGADNERKRNC